MHKYIILLLLTVILLNACSAADMQSPALQPTLPLPTSMPTRSEAAFTTPIPDKTAIPLPAGTPFRLPYSELAATDELADLATSAQPDTEIEVDKVAALSAALQRPPRDQVELARALGGVTDASAVARTTPLDVQVGDVEQFWVTSTATNRTYTVTAELRYAGPVVLMYVEQGLIIDQATLEQAARVFEEQIYPRTRELFGSELQPGVDGDLRITILNGRSPGGGVAGYFSSRDSVPRSVNRFSNEREMFFMNIESVNPANPGYLQVLAHEFQHMIHWNEQRNAAIWFNEGCSTLSEDLNGFVTHSSVMAYLANPNTQLTAWSEVPERAIAHYGAANLFMRYIYTHYTGEEGLVDLIRADAGNNPDAFVELAARTRPDITSFGTLFVDWALANVLNDPHLADGRYSYPTGPDEPEWLPTTVKPRLLNIGTTENTVYQFGVNYYALPDGPLTVEFDGATSVSLVGTEPHGTYAWWSGRGDNSVSTLTHPVNLEGLDSAVLQFDTWYELEKHYDYAFVSVSVDDGTTWQTLAGMHTTNEDPHGANYGNGLNGVSGAPGVDTRSGIRGSWVTETMELSAYIGQPILLRFWQISDDAFNAPGLLIDNIRICSNTVADQCVLEDDVEAGYGDWQAEGFARIDGELPQTWELRLIHTGANGDLSVRNIPTDSAGQATIRLETNERAILVVAATTPHTTEPASYQLRIQ